METAEGVPESTIQLDEWADLPDIGENEGDDQSIESIQISESDRDDVPEASTPITHFRQYILNQTITVKKVDTKFQRADIMTKALPRYAFEFLRKTNWLVRLCEGV